MSSLLDRHWFSVDEFESMTHAGIFGMDARLELFEGEIFEASPIGSSHAACVDFLALRLTEFAQRGFIVRTQNPIQVNIYNEPQPDLPLVRWRWDFYRSAHPRAAGVLLLIEVADTTVETYRTVKIPLYARANIPEVWIINIPDEMIEVYAAPVNGMYQFTRQFRRGEDVAAQSLPNLSVAVNDVLG